MYRPGLEGACLLALQRLVGRGFGELHRIDQAGVLDPGDPRPARAAAILGPCGQDEARLRVLVVGEEPLRIGRAGRLVDLGDVPRAEHALLRADVEALAHGLRPLRGAVVDAARQRRVHRLVLLRPEQHRRVLVLARFPRALERVGDGLFQRRVVEIANRGRAGLVAEMDGDRDVAVELHHVGGDVRVGESRRRAFAAVELDLDGIGLRHVDHLVGDRLYFFAWIHLRRFRGSRVQRVQGFRQGSSGGSVCSSPERQAQWAPPAPHPPPIGIAAFAPPFDAPTMPGLDNRLTRFEPWHDGHSALRSAVTNASKSRSQSLQWYSKIGIRCILSMVNSQLPTSNFQGTPNFQFPRSSSSRLPIEYWEFSWELDVGSALEVGSWKLGVDLRSPVMTIRPATRSLVPVALAVAAFVAAPAVSTQQSGSGAPAPATAAARLRRYPPIRSRCWRGAASGRCAAAGRSP